MSTYRKPPVDWEVLPPEIWTLIFRHATLVPNLISTELYNYGTGDPTMFQQRKLHKRSLWTKQSLVRVCKTWYSSAIRFLYEAVLLGRGKSLASLHEGLLRSHRPSIDFETGELPLGWWTKRLDVGMREATDDAKSDMALVGRIVAMLPNLSILTFDVHGHGYSPDNGGLTLPSSILRSTSPENLNVVYWHSPNVLPTAEDWLELLSSRPHLRSISDFAWGEYRPMATAVPNFPSLTSLHLSRSWSVEYFSHLKLLHLKHLTYRAHYADFAQNLAPFFQNHGANLISLTTDCHASGWNILPLISETCPNLISLELVMEDWSSLPDNWSALPPIRTMKVACGRPQHGRRLYRRLFAFIVDAMSVCPTLKTFRFSDDLSISNLSVHLHVLQSQVKILSEAGIILENAEGSLIDLG